MAPGDHKISVSQKIAEWSPKVLPKKEIDVTSSGGSGASGNGANGSGTKSGFGSSNEWAPRLAAGAPSSSPPAASTGAVID